MQLWWIAAVILMTVLPTDAQIGSECNSNRKCTEHQTCYGGYCKCEPGYVKGHHYCWKVRKHGEECFFDVQCVDHRMQCEVNETHSTVKRCICNRFHTWDEELKECAQSVNISAVLATLHEQQDNIVLNSRSEHEMFIKISVVGLIAVITICIFILSCIAYGCCSWTRLSDLSTNISPKSCPPTCPLHKMPLLQQEQLSSEEGKKNKWKDHCPMPGSFDDIDVC